MSLLQRFASWVRQDYPGPLGPHIALLVLCPERVLEIREDDDGTVWGGWRGQDKGQWVRLSA